MPAAKQNSKGLLIVAIVTGAILSVIAVWAAIALSSADNDSPLPQPPTVNVPQQSADDAHDHDTSDPRIESAIARGAVFVGQSECVECHKDEAEKMSQVRMSRAIELLQNSVDVPTAMNEPQCLGCHVTGYGKPLAAGLTLPDMYNVQCEACHGPGSKYIEIMKNGYSSDDPTMVQKAIEAGLLTKPDKTTCLQCHHDEPGGLPWSYEQHREFIKHWSE